MARLTGKIALVTGGSRGIGAGIPKCLAAIGANVAITYAKRAEAAALVVKAAKAPTLASPSRAAAAAGRAIDGNRPTDG